MPYGLAITLSVLWVSCMATVMAEETRWQQYEEAGAEAVLRRWLSTHSTVTERRLNGLLQSVGGLKLDVEGLRIELSNTRTEPKHIHAAPSPVQKPAVGAATSSPNGTSPWWKPT